MDLNARVLNLSLQVLQAYISIFSSISGKIQLNCFLVVVHSGPCSTVLFGAPYYTRIYDTFNCQITIGCSYVQRLMHLPSGRPLLIPKSCLHRGNYIAHDTMVRNCQ